MVLEGQFRGARGGPPTSSSVGPTSFTVPDQHVTTRSLNMNPNPTRAGLSVGYYGDLDLRLFMRILRVCKGVSDVVKVVRRTWFGCKAVPRTTWETSCF